MQHTTGIYYATTECGVNYETHDKKVSATKCKLNHKQLSSNFDLKYTAYVAIIPRRYTMHDIIEMAFISPHCHRRQLRSRPNPQSLRTVR